MLIALAAILAATSAPPATQPPARAVTAVKVETAQKAPDDVRAWASELRRALAARPEEFRLTKAGEKPELVVRIDSIAPAAGGKQVMNFVFVRASQTQPFSFTYAGTTRSEAERLARNLRMLATPVLAAPAPSASKPAPSGSKKKE